MYAMEPQGFAIVFEVHMGKLHFISDLFGRLPAYLICTGPEPLASPGPNVYNSAILG